MQSVLTIYQNECHIPTSTSYNSIAIRVYNNEAAIDNAMYIIL